MQYPNTIYQVSDIIILCGVGYTLQLEQDFRVFRSTNWRASLAREYQDVSSPAVGYVWKLKKDLEQEKNNEKSDRLAKQIKEIIFFGKGVGGLRERKAKPAEEQLMIQTLQTLGFYEANRAQALNKNKTLEENLQSAFSTTEFRNLSKVVHKKHVFSALYVMSEAQEHGKQYCNKTAYRGNFLEEFKKNPKVLELSKASGISSLNKSLSSLPSVLLTGDLEEISKLSSQLLLKNKAEYEKLYTIEILPPQKSSKGTEILKEEKKDKKGEESPSTPKNLKISLQALKTQEKIKKMQEEKLKRELEKKEREERKREKQNIERPSTNILLRGRGDGLLSFGKKEMV